jgi:hypothetical protein
MCVPKIAEQQIPKRPSDHYGAHLAMHTLAELEAMH